MFAIVSLLDNKHKLFTEKIINELKDNFKIFPDFTNPFPHFFYFVTSENETDGLERQLEIFSQDKISFKARTSGIGLFNAEKPVIFIPVIRSIGLSEFHRELWSLVKCD